MTATSDRYRKLFAALVEQKRGAFIPFTVLGDPNPELGLKIACALVEAGADALELGIAFSDPVADGPTIQLADQRALAAGVRLADAWGITRELRRRYPELPMGLLVYANLVESKGAESFYRAAKEAGIDSVLVADVPTLEAPPYLAAAERCGIQPVLIATPSASDAQLEKIAKGSRGYTYVVTRVGVTGADESASVRHDALLTRLASLGAPPSVLGFGISKPAHVRQAIAAGAAGAISGSAVVKVIERHLEDPEQMLRQLEAFVKEMKTGTLRH
jgi:tryptophan synthase alpha chain